MSGGALLNRDGIAIVGMAARWPGGLEDPEALWAALLEGRDMIETVPPNRWRTEAFHGPLADTGGGAGIAHASSRGGFLRDVELFDAAFFGISAREADTMDPAQRLLLETAWRCWENAGLSPVSPLGGERRVGVFVGGFTQDYQLLHLTDPWNIVVTSHSATGVLQTLLSNRISHVFRFTGPSLTVDTACSSSLVALDLAVNSLRQRDCEMALAGAVQLQLSPYYTTIESIGGFLSPSGRCRAFDQGANGYVRAESIGMLLLAPLERALEEGWPIHAVIAATAVNHNGLVPGITLPDARAQADLIAGALRRAGIGPDDIGYVEAHGTGTRAGDQAEAAALGSVFGKRMSPLWIGSIKTNLGHAEAAAGMNGLIKAVLCLQHQQIPPHLHWTKTPEEIDLQALGLRLPLTTQPWPENAPYAGVSSFGFGGTNAHVILAPAPRRSPASRYQGAVMSTLFISGPSWSHVADQVTAWCQALDQPECGDGEAALIAAATLHQRAHLTHRLHLPGRTQLDLLTACEAYLKEPEARRWIRGEAEAGRNLVWLFSGMGPQWPGMGSGLSANCPVYRQALETCDRRFGELAGYSLLQACAATGTAGTAALPVRWAQPLSIFVQMALCAQMDAWGMAPEALIGHSVGEVAAFHVAGMIDLDTAIAIAWHRSRLLDRLSGSGAMLAIRGSEAQVREWIVGFESLSIAAVNGPEAVTVSGSAAALEALATRLRDRQIQCRALAVAVPFHSPMLDPLEEEFRAALESLTFRAPRWKLYSTVSGARIDHRWASLSFADYWWRNLRAPVAFRATLEAATEELDGTVVFQEIGASPVLLSYVADLPDAIAVATLKRDTADDQSLLECLGQLHALGFSPRWTEIIPPPGRRVELPGAVWRRSPHWSESAAMRIHRLRPLEHPLLGWLLPHSTSTWESTLAPTPEWDWNDHRILGRVRAPGVLFVEIMVAAWRLLTGGHAVRLTQIRFKGVTATKGGQARIRTVADRESGRLSIIDRSKETREVACAVAVTTLSSAAKILAPSAVLNGTLQWDWAAERYYEALRAIGYDYGPSFRCIERIRFSTTEGRADIRGSAMVGVAFPPAVLDATLQSMLFIEVIALANQPQAGSDRLPVEIMDARFQGSVNTDSFPLSATAILVRRNESETVGDVTLTDRYGAVLAMLRGVTLRVLTARSALRGDLRPNDAIYTRVWRTVFDPTAQRNPPASVAASAGIWVIHPNRDGLGVTFAHWLSARGETAVLQNEEGALPPPGARVIDFRAAGGPQVPGPDDQAALLDIITHLREQCRLLQPPSRLWLLTSGAFADDGQCRPLQRAVWSLGCAAGEVEHADIFGGIVDLPVSALPCMGSTDWHARLYEVVTCERPETQYRIDSQGELRVPELRRCGKEAQPASLILRQDGTYIVTGGFGALGRHAVELLVSSGARSIVLVGRTSLPARSSWKEPQSTAVAQRIAWILRLEEEGVRITVIAGDLGSPKITAALTEAISRRGLPIVRGIVHAAGALADKAFSATSAAMLQQVLSPKMAGINSLLAAIQLQGLDFVVLYSSIASMMPNYGQAAYAAANGYLDGMATWLCQQGVPAQSINWGPWTVGMAQADHIASMLRGQGLLPITPQEGSQLLSLGLNLHEPQILCAGVDWNMLARQKPAHRWFFASMIGQMQSETRLPDPQRNLKALDREQREAAVLERLAAIAALVMHGDPLSLSRNTILVTVGIDSLMAVEIQSQVAAELRVNVAVEELLAEQSLGNLAKRLAGRMA